MNRGYSLALGGNILSLQDILGLTRMGNLKGTIAWLLKVWQLETRCQAARPDMVKAGLPEPQLFTA